MKQSYNSKNDAFSRMLCFAKCLIKNPMGYSNPALLIFFLVLFVLPFLSFSQINVLNNGLPIINNNLDVLINGNVVHQNNGNITNDGNFHITGDWINDNPPGNSGKVFTTGGQGWMHLDGAAQIIGGNSLTHFNNLELSGSGVKQLNSVNTEIEDTLSLNDLEFSLGDNTAFVIASGSGVVTQTTGFASSTNDGGLSRNTLSTDTYFFPVGSSAGTARFRPVDITPNSASATTFKVRMANVDPTSEGFYRTLKEGSIGEINQEFYHRINRTNGNSPADITLYYDNIADGEYDIITQWQNTPQWENLGPVSATGNYGLSGLTAAGYDNFSTTPFALSSEVIASVFVPNIFSPNGDGFNDLLFVRGKGIAEMEFIIYNRWGEKVFETTNMATGWDGTYLGEPLNLAVFVYVVKGKFKNGELIDKKGNFTLLR